MTSPPFPVGVAAIGNDGYDGQFSLILALHIASGKDLANDLDSPRYRARRIMLPVLSIILAAGAAGAIPLAYLFLNALFVALSTGVIASVAVERGRSPWWSALVVLSCGTIVSLWRATVDVSMCAFLLFAVVAASRGRWRGAAVALAAAILAKEVALIAVPCLLLAAPPDRRARAWIIASVLVPALWWLAVMWLFPPDPVSSLAVNFSAPFAGFLHSLITGLGQVKPVGHIVWDAFLLVVHALAILAGLALGWVALRRPPDDRARMGAALCAGAFALLCASCSSAVWVESWAYARVLLPLVLLLLLVAIDRPPLGRFRTGLCLIPPSLAAAAGLLTAIRLVATRTP